MKSKAEVKRAFIVLAEHLLSEDDPATPPPPDADPWMSISSAAAYTDLAPDTLRRAVAAGELTAAGEGKSRRIRRSALDRWIEGAASSRRPTDEIGRKADRILSDLGLRPEGR